MIALDLSKAFDRVSHLSILQTIARGDLPYRFILWIQSFLTTRSQKVVFNGVSSSMEVPVTSGVPQGSVLAPILFAAQVGSLEALHPQTQLIKYADDFTLLIPYSGKVNDSMFTACVKEEMDHIREWCGSHKLMLNEDKTKCIFFGTPGPSAGILDVLPPEVMELKVLGIIYQNTLKWDKHTDYISKAAGRRVHVLRYLRHIKSITKKT
jgi:hypothetical protein